MQIHHSFRPISLLSVGILLCLPLAMAYAASVELDWITGSAASVDRVDRLMFARSENKDANEETPRSGTLVMPASGNEDVSEKKCMTVCQRWGQDCVIDSRRGVRKCRRTCKEFGQECF